jgi:hypothetical protein
MTTLPRNAMECEKFRKLSQEKVLLELGCRLANSTS